MPRYLFTVLLLVVSLTIPIALSTQENPNVELATLPPSEEEEEVFEEREPLTDIIGHWAETEINNLYQTRVVNGYGDGTFGPDDPVTRTQFLIIALRAFNYDVPDENYAEFAYEVGIISDLELWRDEGAQNVSKAEALKILLNAGGLDAGESLSPNFADVDIVNDWFAVYSAFGMAQDILSGDETDDFNGNENVSRAETCVLTVRIMERQPSEIED